MLVKLKKGTHEVSVAPQGQHNTALVKLFAVSRLWLSRRVSLIDVREGFLEDRQWAGVVPACPVPHVAMFPELEDLEKLLPGSGKTRISSADLQANTRLSTRRVGFAGLFSLLPACLQGPSS